METLQELTGLLKRREEIGKRIREEMQDVLENHAEERRALVCFHNHYDVPTFAFYELGKYESPVTEIMLKGINFKVSEEVVSIFEEHKEAILKLI